ncbi:hypothetical protein [Streptomyces sp. NPDC001833]|uniref:hypothetical protein n=1 Tax=Streptomyces sp. NPDC001833 TaxID=3154658 RepID=UPI003332C7E7
MFSRKKIATVSGLVGGIAVACVGLAPAYAAVGPGKCTNDLLGNLTCTQRVKGVVPEGGSLPHRETCGYVEPPTVLTLLGVESDRTRPEGVCSHAADGVAPVEAGDEQGAPGRSFGAMGRTLPVGLR